MNKTKLPEKANIKISPLKIIAIFLVILLILALISIIVLRVGKTNTIASGFSWCQSGNSLKLEDATLTAVGIEDYQSSQYQDKVCHLQYIRDNKPSELYLDEEALIAFPKSRQTAVGNGCLVYPVDKMQKNAELCFGSKIKSLSSPTTTNFAGTKWRYMIQVGGGVGGVMTFEKDEAGSLSGIFTEFGPGGEKEKTFVGSYETDNFLLTLEEFPTFKVTLSSDGKTITGKPIEETEDIFYPDDFFKATRE